jgi:hypothetical protein
MAPDFTLNACSNDTQRLFDFGVLFNTSVLNYINAMNTYGGRKNSFKHFFALEGSISEGLGIGFCVDQRRNNR